MSKKKMNMGIHVKMNKRMKKQKMNIRMNTMDVHEDEYENALQVVGMAGLFLLLLLAGTAGAWIWSCR